jgi:iron complex transport system substrate-binding protein
MRVVSLLPSATEIVGALGGIDQVVGVTHECDWPPVVSSRLRVTSCSVDSSRGPREVDAQVRELSHAGTPLYTLNERAIRGLHPDVILTQALCDVCAVHEGDVRALAASLPGAPTVLTLNATTLEGVFDDIKRVGDVLGLADESEELLIGSHQRLDAVHTILKNARAPRPRVAVVEWGDPIFTGGHWVPDMIRRAGGTDVIGQSGEHSKTITINDLQSATPDILVIAPCGYDLPRARMEANRLLSLDEWKWTQGLQVWAMDANAFASRPGPRLVGGVEIFARIFNPSLFSPLDPAHAERIA